MTESPSISTTPPRDAELTRVLGAADAASIMISNMIGVGILTLPGMVAVSVGDFKLALLAWALGGLISLAGALVHAELGSRFPLAGGDYVFLREAFGKLAAFLSGWTSFVVGFPGAIAASSMAAANCIFDAIFDAASAPKDRLTLLLSLAILAGISLVHSLGLEWGKKFQNLLVALKLLILAVIVAAGFLLMPSAKGGGAISAGGPHLATAAFFILFAYSGWNSAAYVAGEIRDPRKNLPLALIGGVLAVTAIYLAVNLSYFRVVPLEEMGKNINILGEVARRIFGEWGGQVVSLALSLVFVGSASAMVITGPRIYYAMAGDGLFPRSIAKVSPKRRVPFRALWLQSLWAAGILAAGTALTGEGQTISDTFERIVGWTIFAILPFAALTTSSVFVLRRRDGARDPVRSYAAPGHPWTPAAFVVATLAIEIAFVVVGLSPALSGDWAPRNRMNAIVGSLLVLSGIPAYLLWSWAGRRSGSKSPG